MIYGVTDIANIDNFEKAPPEIVFINPVKVPVALASSSFKTTELTPGTIIKHPNLNTNINNNVNRILLLISGFLSEFFIVFNN